MGNRNHCTLGKLMINQLLNHLLSHNVDISSCFVKDNDLIFPKDCSTDTDKLFFTSAQIGSSLLDLEVNSSAFLLALLPASLRSVEVF